MGTLMLILYITYCQTRGLHSPKARAGTGPSRLPNLFTSGKPHIE